MHVKGIDEIWSSDLVDMSAFSKDNHGVKYLLTIIDVFSKYAWVMPLKTKTGKDITKAFDYIIEGSGRKPSRLWVDKGTEFTTRRSRIFGTERHSDVQHTQRRKGSGCGEV